jgi:hypothetical protein
VNRADLRKIATIRLQEAKTLQQSRKYSGAYYLAGYSIECGFKACIAKSFGRFEFPDKKKVDSSYTHNLRELAKIAGLEPDREQRSLADTRFLNNWTIVVRWSEASRYRVYGRLESKGLLDAIIERDHGIMPWIVKNW